MVVHYARIDWLLQAAVPAVHGYALTLDRTTGERLLHGSNVSLLAVAEQAVIESFGSQNQQDLSFLWVSDPSREFVSNPLAAISLSQLNTLLGEDVGDFTW
jgi:hypothetical protein